MYHQYSSMASEDSGGLYIGTTGVACIGAHRLKKIFFLSTNSPLPHRVTQQKNRTFVIDQESSHGQDFA
jgi:hypothetical protein